MCAGAVPAGAVGSVQMEGHRAGQEERGFVQQLPSCAVMLLKTHWKYGCVPLFTERQAVIVVCPQHHSKTALLPRCCSSDTVDTVVKQRPHLQVKRKRHLLLPLNAALRLRIR